MKVILMIIVIYLFIAFLMFLIVSIKFKKSILKYIDRKMEKALLSYKDYFDKGNTWVSKQKKDHLFLFSSDNVRLHAIFIKNKNSNKFMILSHGYRSTCIRDIYPSCENYYKLGYNLVIIDQRTSLKSDGNYITLGYYEHKDLSDWVDYIKLRFKDSKIILGGVSMGATSSLLCASINKNVDAVVADCAFKNGYYEVAHVMKKFFFLPSFLFVGLINLYCKIFAKFDLRDVDVIKACKNIKVPVLLIHGKCDDFIPYQDSEEIYDNLKCKKEIHLFDKAQHGMSFLVESDRYLSILKEFLKKVK